MNKRGQAAEQVLEAGKLLFYILIALLLFAIFYSAWDVIFKQPASIAVNDRDRVVKELAALQQGESMKVFTTGSGYAIELFGEGNTNDYCKGKPCVCESESKKCVLLQKMQSCEKGLCAPAAQESVPVVQGQPVTICRKDNALHIGSACGTA